MPSNSAPSFEISARPPAFLVEFDRAAECRLEVTTRPEALGAEHAAGSERVVSDVLRPESGFLTRTWRLPTEAWEVMRRSQRLYYRSVPAVSEPGSAGAEETAFMTVSSRSSRQLGRLLRQLPSGSAAEEVDEARWRTRADDRRD